MESMYENQVWDLVIPPEGVKPIECKWIFKRKTDTDGNVTIHKARLAAKGFRQVQGVDYDETFSPVAMLKSVEFYKQFLHILIMRYGRWTSRQCSFTEISRKMYT